MNKPPTDLEILREIYQRYYDVFVDCSENVTGRNTKKHTTLNEQFRLWLADYTRREQQAKRAMEVARELRGKVRTGGRKFTRE